MLERIKRILRNISNLDEDKLLQQSFDNTQIQADIISLNTEEQLFNKGLFADGKQTGDYSIATIYGTKNFKGKIEKGQPYDHITFKDTGELYGSFRFINDYKSFTLVANTVKNGTDLEQRDGKIVGLTNDSLQEVRLWITPIFIRKTKKEILK